MMPLPDTSSAGPGQNAWFTTTHWSVVLAVGGAESPAARQALEQLCRNYWYPLYAYVRRNGHSEEDAKDVTQAFFADLLERKDLAHVNPEKGRFRCFLLACLNNFLLGVWKKASAQKRGGGKAIVPLDDSTAEGRYRLEPVDAKSPEDLLDVCWARTVFKHAGETLREEYCQSGRSELYEAVRAYLTGETNTTSYAELAGRLGCQEATVKSYVRRLRRRFKELLRKEVANAVGDPGEVDEEMRYLVGLVGRCGAS
jgi:RNA polymerase sigma-70 factor (ECF subfamily)